ncbi:MAG: 3'-5' exonuclease [Deltaproteobacteria bacterium]
MAGALVFDIETVPDLELGGEPRRERGEGEGIPKIPFNRVVLLGAATLAGDGEAGYRLEALEVLRGPEVEILSRFWPLAEGKRLVSFNGRRFDLPVLEARSLRHGLAVPWYFRDRTLLEGPERHLDLLDFLSNGEPRNRAKLDDYCKLVGLPGKMGVDGSQVAELFASHRVDELSAYCATDVLQTLGLFLRVERLRGALRSQGYREMLRGVRDAIERRVEERAGLERDRLRAFLAKSESFWATA